VNADPTLEVPGVAADLYRLFANLIDNSLRHTPHGGRITLSAQLRDGRAEARVGDTGSGIAPAELPRVFDRFYRARGEPGQGSGLGLSIARAIAHAHAGTLVLSNEPGGGCRASWRCSPPWGSRLA
jgi:two-component system sensor histidine kinase BaeS